MSENMATKLRKQIGGRNLTSKIIGYTLLALIGIVFVFFSGVGGSLPGMGMGSVARVNDSLISAADLQNEENRIQEYYSNLFGGNFNLGSQRNMVRQQALESLVRAELTAQAAQREGIRATDAEIRDVIIRDIPVFQENGQFLRERYMGYLQASRMSPGDFEGRLRKDLESMRVRQLLEAAAFPMTLEVQKMAELQGAKLNISFARIDSELLGREAKGISAVQVSAALAQEDFQKRAQEYFQSYKSDWSTEETATAQHILIAFDPNSPESQGQALTKIQDLKKRASSEDFGKLAAQFSEDPGSKDKQGRLEPFTRGRMVKEFEEAAFSQPIGQVGEPVKSPFGYHLIKVTQRTVAQEAKFEEVREEVARRLLARDQIDARLKELDDAVRAGDQAKVESLLASIGVRWEETGLFDLANAVPKLPAGPVAEAAFEVTSQKPLLNRVVREGGVRYVLKLKEAKSEPVNVDAQARELMQKRRADQLFSSWLENFRERSKVNVNSQVFNQ